MQPSPHPISTPSGQAPVVLTWDSSGGPSRAPSSSSQRQLCYAHKQIGPLLNTVHGKLEKT